MFLGNFVSKNLLDLKVDSRVLLVAGSCHNHIVLLPAVAYAVPQVVKL
jgi:hypothetical protein